MVWSPFLLLSIYPMFFVPSIKQNLISVSKFCRSNKTSIEFFFPLYFVVKDLFTGTPLLREKKLHYLYEWSTIESANNNHVVGFSTGDVAPTSQAIWHGLLGHPSLKIPNHLIQSKSVSLSSSCSSNSVCHSCLCNQSQHLPFGKSSLESHGPLDLIYTDVWGPPPVQSIDGFNYFVRTFYKIYVVLPFTFEI